MNKAPRFYNRRRETISRKALEALHLRKLHEMVLFCAVHSPLYKKKGLRKTHANFDSFRAFEELPLTSKQDLLAIDPKENLCVPLEEVAEVHFSSGTSGKSTPSYMSYKDLKISSEYLARTWFMQGVCKESVFAMCASYGLFSGGFINHYAIQDIGSFIIPIGNASALKTLETMSFFNVDACAAVASYYPYLIAMAEAHGVDLGQLRLKHVVAGGEPFSEQERQYVEKKFNAQMYNQYGLCEINTGLAGECGEKNGLHILADYVYPEIIDPETGAVLGDEQEGELVLTTLHREASPLIRYRTGDITSITYAPCVCGRTMPRIASITRRVTETIFYKGLKIERPQVDDMFSKMTHTINPYLWQLMVQRNGSKDELSFKVALHKKDGKSLQTVAAHIHKHLGIKSTVAAFSAEELSQLGNGKLKHFIDYRRHT